MFLAGNQYTTKSTLAQILGWPMGLVEELLGHADYLMRNDRPGGYDMQMYSIAQAQLFHDCPEVLWRKARKTRRQIKPSSATLDAWKNGTIDDMAEATRWSIQRAEQGQATDAMAVARHLDEHHLDIFYGLARNHLASHQLRALVRLPQMSEPALRRHLVRALRKRREVEALALGQHPLIQASDNPEHVDVAFQNTSVNLASRLGGKMTWRDTHAEIAARMVLRTIKKNDLWQLKYMPGHILREEHLDRGLAGFIERTRRDMGAEGGADILAWARSIWKDDVILASLGRVSQRLHGGPQHRNVANFTKLFEQLAKNMPAFEDQDIKHIKKSVGKDDDLRSERFRSLTLRKQLVSQQDANPRPDDVKRERKPRM